METQMRKNTSVTEYFDIETVKTVLPYLPAKYGHTLQQLYFENKTVKEIADEEKVKTQSIYNRLTHIKAYVKKLYNVGLKNCNLTSISDTYFHSKFATSAMFSIGKYRDVLDFETEVIPYLPKNQLAIYNLIFNEYNGENLEELSKKMGIRRETFLSRYKLLVNKIQKIAKKKEDIKAFCDNVGGYDFIQDVKSLLTDTEQAILDNYILNLSPYSILDLRKQLNNEIPPYFSRYVELIQAKLSRIYSYKLYKDNLIEKYGDEEFLINQFGKRMLTDEQLFVLKYSMLDYHHVSKQVLARKRNLSERSIYHITTTILRKLDRYKAREKSLEKFIESNGGVENILSRLDNLDSIEQIILHESILTPLPLNNNKIARKLDTSPTVIFRKQMKLEERINKTTQNFEFE